MTRATAAARSPRAGPLTDSPTVAVVVLNWNGLDDTRACVRSLLAQGYGNCAVHVVDNGSDNAEAEVLEREFVGAAEIHRNAHNLGFTGGHNILLRSLLAGSCV